MAAPANAQRESRAGPGRGRKAAAAVVATNGNGHSNGTASIHGTGAGPTATGVAASGPTSAVPPASAAGAPPAAPASSQQGLPEPSDYLNGWIESDADLLTRLRSALRAPVLSPYTTPHGNVYLRSGIGKRSPTVVGRRRRATAAGEDGAGSGLADVNTTACAIESAGSSGTGQGLLEDPQTGLVPQSKFAVAMREQFRAVSVSEPDVLAEFIYAVRMSDKSFRHRGIPTRKR